MGRFWIVIAGTKVRRLSLRQRRKVKVKKTVRVWVETIYVGCEGNPKEAGECGAERSS